MADTDLKVIGTPQKRTDGRPKVTGQERFAGDLKLAGLVYARPVLAQSAHAKVLGVDGSAAMEVDGVIAVLTAEDLPFDLAKTPPRASESLARKEIVYAGQPVALVIAETAAVAAVAADLVEVEIEELPVVLDIEAALKPDSPLARVLTSMKVDAAEAALHGITVGAGADEEEGAFSDNLSNESTLEMGDVEKGFAEADVIVEGTFHTPWVYQGYLEPQVCVAAPDPIKGVIVYASTQGQFRTRQVVAQSLGLDDEFVTVHSMPIGGGFGGKFGLIEPLTAAVALVVNRPVRLEFTRHEDLVAANPAPAGKMELMVGANKAGKLTAIDARIVFDTGAYPGSPVSAVAFALAGCYHFPNLHIQGYEVMTNRLGPGAYRAPGNPQGAFAIESLIDDLADELGLDPIAFRLQNVPVEGDPRPDGQAWPLIGLADCLEEIQKHPVWTGRNGAGEGRYREGYGVGVGGWRGGLEPAAAFCGVDSSGFINVVTGVSDLSGTYTTFRMIAAEALGVNYDLVRVVGADTSNSPYAGGSGGSKTVYTVGQAVQRAAEDAKQQILELAGHVLEVAPDDLEMAGDRVRVKGVEGNPERELTIKRIAQLSSGFGGRYAPITGRGAGAQTMVAPGFSAQLAHVRVDTETGNVELLDFVAAQDVGRALNPAAVEGQMIGAVVQGIGWGLLEEMAYDENGQLISGTFMDYAMPKAESSPNIDILIVEVPSPNGPYGARGVGEPPVIPGAAAIANAIHAATGIRPDSIPITPEKLWRQLNEA